LGGTLIAFNQSASSLIPLLSLPVRNVLQGLGNDKFYCAGSLLRVEMQHPDVPINFGVPMQTNAAGSSFGISWGVDNNIKTPYSEVFNLSIQRELPGGFTLEAAWAGRFGRRLLQQSDIATPVNLLDPKSGTTYFQASAQLAALLDQNGGKGATVPAIAYFENMFPQLATGGLSATQNIYNKEFTTYRKVLGETTALADLDFYCVYGCPASAPTNRFFQGQFSSLYAWTTNGSASYNAGQFSGRSSI